MAKKRSKIVVVQAPKAVKRGGQNKPPRHSNGMQVSGNVRAAISSSMPRPFRAMRSMGDDVIEVKGMELIQPITTSQAPLSFAFLLNPGNSQYFKSLASIAFAYEKYRFRNLRLRYWTQSPSSRSGVISGVILLDPLQPPPAEPQAFMAYAHSMTRAISLDGMSVPHRIVDNKWLYVASDSSSSNGTDPTTRYQGLIAWQSQGSSSADEKLLAGYLGLEYTVEFTGHRPMRNTIISLQPKSASIQTNRVLTYDSMPNCVGSYDLQIEGKGETVTSDKVPGYSTSTTYSNSLMSYLGKHLINYYLPLGAATVDGVPIPNEKGFVPRPSVSLSRRRRGSSWILEVGGVVTDTVPSWVDVHCQSSEDEKKSGVLQHPIRLKDLRADETYILRGNAAGDVTVTTQCSEPDGSTVDTIDSVVTSSGTGSLNLRRCYLFDETDRNCRIRLAVFPTGVETRTLSEGGSVQYSEFTGDENTF